MGMFAETENVDYRLSFADQGKELMFSVAKNKRKFAVSVCMSTYIKTAAYIYIYKYICFRFKQKTEASAIFLNPFTVCSSCKRKLPVFKQTKRPKRTCPSM